MVYPLLAVKEPSLLPARSMQWLQQIAALVMMHAERFCTVRPGGRGDGFHPSPLTEVRDSELHPADGPWPQSGPRWGGWLLLCSACLSPLLE